MKDSQMANLRHELLSDIALRVAEHAKEFNLQEAAAEQLGWMIADHLAEQWGGHQMNFPKDVKFTLTKRDMEIYEQFKGTNHWQLAKAYSMSTRAIYKVIARVRKYYVDERQPSLF